MDLHDSNERGVEVICLGFLRVEDLDRICPSGDREDRSFEEILRELDGIKCGGGDDQLQVRSLFYCLQSSSTVDVTIRAGKLHVQIRCSV